MFRVGILTVSDKGAQGVRQDLSAAEIRQQLPATRYRVEAYALVPDELEAIVVRLVEWSDQQHLDLILTTGGTGVSPRDLTPEATQAVVDRSVPGLAEAMRAASLDFTPHAMLSRAQAGIRGQTLIINLPGSPRAVRENLAVVLPALPHALEKIQGRAAECGSP
ncbi:MAG: MogA/MoaB family molybdenum cofactor biosynthesis protein [Deltaproteobacteria bacterium]|nr:MogA/MoaB family molybdenum cofactor biosynthesis protein [Deltaproteobacteria bacterium]MBW1953476.1 MogA/MoaB family molybdenum cofactor biosynthesis protein [Deltaproteobacteria bacterium]MBW1986047.1 MogA/MoaB family molybdenum cofactor biosynthesis protein [Deltaproteobacteria bacterium]MBW2133948.1 MogA/MoaB family molybdenum cofactor biosynthesis protein [Deltaproteobacteria bacterium]